ncbi:MAG TPA: mechanosensitive ion channel domain-containing protein [Trebonia sp.]|nr:mechanosensitive ion channel domain-containing protein [Trebonia sp.]
MHLPDGPQLDLSAQVAKVKAKAKPWRSIIALVLAIIAGVTSGWAHRGFQDYFSTEHVPKQIVAAACTVAFCAFASIATYGLSGNARTVLEPRAGAAHAAIVRYALLLVGAFTTLIVTLDLFRVPVGQLVLGGALTSVFVGIAAQQALGNVFAGIVLLVARPFRVGDQVRLRAGAIGGEIEGTVTEIGITYVRMFSGGVVLSVPNSQVLNAVVGPVPPGSDPADPVPTDSVPSGSLPSDSAPHGHADNVPPGQLPPGEPSPR